MYRAGTLCRAPCKWLRVHWIKIDIVPGLMKAQTSKGDSGKSSNDRSAYIQSYVTLRWVLVQMSSSLRQMTRHVASIEGQGRCEWERGVPELRHEGWTGSRMPHRWHVPRTGRSHSPEMLCAKKTSVSQARAERTWCYRALRAPFKNAFFILNANGTYQMF